MSNIFTILGAFFGILVILVSAFALARATNAKTIMELQKIEIDTLATRLNTEHTGRRQLEHQLDTAKASLAVLERVVTGKRELEEIKSMVREHDEHVDKRVDEIKDHVDENIEEVKDLMRAIVRGP